MKALFVLKTVPRLSGNACLGGQFLNHLLCRVKQQGAFLVILNLLVR